jgi:hypothetical protein
MATRKPKPAAHTGPADSTQAVDDFMQHLEHPFKADIQTLRETILGADPTIAEGIKWNAPSFRTGEYFATTHLRAKGGVGLVLHLGAKVRDLAPGAVRIDDPLQLLQWLATDRAMIVFNDVLPLAKHRAALAAIIRQWIGQV